MRNILYLLFLTLPLNALAQSADVGNAMRDEMKRTKSLQMKGFDKPYFVSYHFTEDSYVEILASLGSLLYNKSDGEKNALVNMRVGSKKFDNSGFDFYRALYKSAGDGYPTVRDAFWRASDSAYKQALEQLSQKRAFMQQRAFAEEYDDFSFAPKSVIKEPLNKEVFDAHYFAEVAKDLSSAGKDYPALKKFVVSVEYQNSKKYYLDSAGSESFQNPLMIKISLTASLQTKDGFEITDEKSTIYSSVKDVPPAQELKQEAAAYAAKIAALNGAVQAESYIGPVWLSGGAGAAFLDELFLTNIINSKPLLLPRGSDDTAGEFAQRLGLRVISHFFNVYDDPSSQEYKGKTLAGHYSLDEEGVKGARVDLVKRGKLAGLPTTRSLIKGQKTSNGHARREALPRAMVSNIFFNAQRTVKEGEFKAKFLQECALQELEYCYKIDSLGGKTFNAYKVYVDGGKEEPVYGAEFNNLSTRSLRDILHAGDDEKAYNALYFTVPYSIIAPSLIVGEMEIKPTQRKPAKPPLVKAPGPASVKK